MVRTASDKTAACAHTFHAFNTADTPVASNTEKRRINCARAKFDGAHAVKMVWRRHCDPLASMAGQADGMSPFKIKTTSQITQPNTGLIH